MARGGGGAENLQVLSALDAAKTQWYHFTAIVISTTNLLPCTHTWMEETGGN
jgi:hypothetical protein